jgi:hypothetical protein
VTDSSGQRRMGRPRVSEGHVSEYLKITFESTRKMVVIRYKYSYGKTIAVQKPKPMNTPVDCERLLTARHALAEAT